jgi:hypothetical protein
MTDQLCLSCKLYSDFLRKCSIFGCRNHDKREPIDQKEWFDE